MSYFFKDKEYSKVVGIDPSENSTGWAAWDSNDSSLVFGHFPTTKIKGLERLIYIRDSIRTLTTPECLVIVEDFGFSRANRAHDMGGLGWMIRLDLYERGIDYLLVGPKQLKKFVTNNGNSDKSMLAMHAAQRWHHTFNNNDEADATGLCYIGRALLGEYRPKTEEEHETLKVILARSNGVLQKKPTKKRKLAA